MLKLPTRNYDQLKPHNRNEHSGGFIMGILKPNGPSKSDRLEYRLYVILLYPFFLAGAVLSKLFGSRYTDDQKTNANMFSLSLAQLNSTLPWIYMGR